jgi:uracil-DNA glycosylase
MIGVELQSHTDFDGWRHLCRHLLADNVPPDQVKWRVEGEAGNLFAKPAYRPQAARPSSPALRVPKQFIDCARRAVCHTDPGRFSRLYRILGRLQRDKNYLEHVTEADVRWLEDCDKAIRRDIHKTHAFVRFREVSESTSGKQAFAAWFEPTYRTLELSAPFFQRRFSNMDWIIVTPFRSAIWDGKTLRYTDGGSKSDVPSEDAVEDQWRTYFRSIFNPARLKVSAMTSEMPRKYWKNLPEADLIPHLIATASERTKSMQVQPQRMPNPLAGHLIRQRMAQPAPALSMDTLPDVNHALSTCTKCLLCQDASQAVPGEGPTDARLMIVGEQPGDQEDISGRPFVGPAGQLLDQVMIVAGLKRSETYVTNAVKHFKFQLRGKRRMHQRPNAGEIDACRWWLDLERRLVRPDLIVALGASAARGVLGHSVKVGDVRGKILEISGSAPVLVTVHPSYLLRLPDPERALLERQRLIQDLKLGRDYLERSAPLEADA